MTDTVDAPSRDLAQERRLVTELPGPRSRELIARRTAAVSAGVGTMLPVFITDASGGVLRDVDGNSLIDLGAGIAVMSVGNAAPHVVQRVREQVGRFIHTCFMITPYEGYVEAAKRSTGSLRAITRSVQRCSTPVPKRSKRRSRSSTSRSARRRPRR